MKWSKELALEIIQAGYLRMSKKLHPDVGGTHDQMLELIATKEHLEKSIAGGRSESTWSPGPDFTRARESPRKPYRTRSSYWRNTRDEYTGDVPLEPYPHDADYVQFVDVTIMEIREKAFKIKIPGVKVAQWLPKSQIHEEVFAAGGEYVEGDVLTIVFTKWIAKQKGWMK